MKRLLAPSVAPPTMLPLCFTVDPSAVLIFPPGSKISDDRKALDKSPPAASVSVMIRNALFTYE